MLHGDATTTITTDADDELRRRCDSLPDQSAAATAAAAAAVVGAKRKSILKKEALNREEMEGLLSSGSGAGGCGVIGSSRNSFATPVDGTPARGGTTAAAADNEVSRTPPLEYSERKCASRKF